eukprot:14306-Eustigmatos_ZCMA.PRE.1
MRSWQGKSDRVRMGEALKKERNDVIEKLIKLNPLYRPPSDYVRPKPFRKLYIPQNEYPQYNFIGLIIGTWITTVDVLHISHNMWVCRMCVSCLRVVRTLLVASALEIGLAFDL